MAKPLFLIARTLPEEDRLRAAWPGVPIQTSLDLPVDWPEGLDHGKYLEDMIEKGEHYRKDLSALALEFPGPETANEL
jgi:hypothetical protein